MKNYLEEVDKIIESALTEKTFNLDIVQKIKEMRDELLMLQNRNVVLEKDLGEKITLISGVNNRNTELMKRVEDFEKRENSLSASEKVLYIKEQKADNESAKLNLVVDLFKTVFRNTEIRSSIHKNVPIVNQGYVTSAIEDSSVDTIKS